MRYSEKPLRQAAAWLIPGAEPRIWLDEMLAWGVPLGDAVLYRIPRSARDLSPQGVLVVLPAGSRRGPRIAASRMRRLSSPAYSSRSRQ